MTAGASFKGSITALVTPFRSGAFDEPAFRALIDWQIESGTHGFVPVGTTGEGPTLSHEEHRRVVEACIEETRGRASVLAGAGSNSTAEAIDLAKHAEKAGADGVLVVTPYYNKPSQEGMYQHFKAVNDAIGIPIVIYNIPPRSVVDMSIDTMKRLYELKNVVGVKDATASLARTAMQRSVLGADFIQLSGEDITALGVMAHFGHLERCPAPMCGDAGSVSRRRLPSRACDPGQADAAACRAVRGAQPGWPEMRPRGTRSHPRRSAPADAAGKRACARAGPAGHGARGSSQLSGAAAGARGRLPWL